MKSAYAVRRGPSPVVVVTFVVVTLLIGIALTIGSLWALGVDLPFLSRKVASVPPAAPVKRTGTPVHLCARAIPAYTKLSREHFLDPKTNDLVVYYLSEEDVKRGGLIVDLRQLLGRVTTHDMVPGFGFTEKDVFPKGTRPGLVAGIPAGKRAFVLLADKIQGIHGLKAGDRFDLLGSLQVDIDKALAKYKAPNQADLLAPGMVGQSPKRADVKVLVQNGAVVIPVSIREVPTGSAGAGKGAKIPTKPVEEITIAVDPEEVAVLSEALAVSANVVCVARSGQPEDPGARSVTPGSNPGPSLRTMETIVGGKRQTLIFPGPGLGPQPAAESGPTELLPTPASTSKAQ